MNTPRPFYVIYLQKSGLMSQFNILCRAQCVLPIGETRSQYYFSIQSYGNLKPVKTSNLKAHNNEKMAVKEKEPYVNII